VGFAIVKFNDEAPKSWNIITRRKRGCCWYVCGSAIYWWTGGTGGYEIDPQTVKQRGEVVEWSPADNRTNRSRLPNGKPAMSAACSGEVSPRQDGHILELQIPILINGKPAY